MGIQDLANAEALFEIAVFFNIVILLSVSDLLSAGMNYSPLQAVISIYFVVICVPPLAYYLSKFLPSVWKSIVQAMIRFAEKHNRLQRALNFFKKTEAKNNKE
jgi:hypothetical protein